MLAVGLALDLVYDRGLDYQPGWLAVPLGLLELAVVLALARILELGAPLLPALAFYAGSWVLAQALAQAGFPLLRLSYADDGGELGLLGGAVAAAALVLFGTAGAYAWSTRPPVVHLSAGIHQGPIVITKRQHLVGERGASSAVGSSCARVTSSSATSPPLVATTASRSTGSPRRTGRRACRRRTLDGIHVRRSTVDIRDCRVDSPGG